METFPTVFVLHVQNGYEERGAHIEKMMSELGIDFKYILRGDKSELTPEVMSCYFGCDILRLQASPCLRRDYRVKSPGCSYF